MRANRSPKSAGAASEMALLMHPIAGGDNHAPLGGAKLAVTLVAQPPSFPELDCRFDNLAAVTTF